MAVIIDSYVPLSVVLGAGKLTEHDVYIISRSFLKYFFHKLTEKDMKKVFDTYVHVLAKQSFSIYNITSLKILRKQLPCLIFTTTESRFFKKWKLKHAATLLSSLYPNFTKACLLSDNLFWYAPAWKSFVKIWRFFGEKINTVTKYFWTDVWNIFRDTIVPSLNCDYASHSVKINTQSLHQDKLSTSKIIIGSLQLGISSALLSEFLKWIYLCCVFPICQFFTWQQLYDLHTKALELFEMLPCCQIPVSARL